VTRNEGLRVSFPNAFIIILSRSFLPPVHTASYMTIHRGHKMVGGPGRDYINSIHRISSSATIRGRWYPRSWRV